MEVKDVHDITRSVCNRNKAKQSFQKHPICLNESDINYILKVIEYRDKTDYERNLNVDGDEE